MIGRTRRQESLSMAKATSSFFEIYDETSPKLCSDKQKYFLDCAAEVAMKSSMGHKHGAIIVHKKKIIASGHNYRFSHFCHDFSIHAEVAAISSLKGKAKNLLSESELYVVRIGPAKFYDALKYSKPCDKCQEAISKYNIKKVYYSTNYNYDLLTTIQE